MVALDSKNRSCGERGAVVGVAQVQQFAEVTPALGEFPKDHGEGLALLELPRVLQLSCSQLLSGWGKHRLGLVLPSMFVTKYFNDAVIVLCSKAWRASRKL